MEEELIELPPVPGPFFRFTNEKAWLKAARAAGFMTTVADEEGNESEQLQAYTHSHAIDVVGVITVGGEWDEEGNETVAPTTLDGFHVNYVGDLPDGWEALEVTPGNPYRVFA
ncbi:MAG: hypothetical protein CBC48_05395 [bacterium TMED88]|nr:MAG: hypothetical protein CBC48_05395 [bacterium TMED88]